MKKQPGVYLHGEKEAIESDRDLLGILVNVAKEYGVRIKFDPRIPSYERIADYDIKTISDICWVAKTNMKPDLKYDFLLGLLRKPALSETGLYLPDYYDNRGLMVQKESLSVVQRDRLLAEVECLKVHDKTIYSVMVLDGDIGREWQIKSGKDIEDPRKPIETIVRKLYKVERI